MTENIVVLFKKSVSKITAIAFLGSAMIFSTAASAETAAEASIPVDVLKSQDAESALGEADPAFRMIFNKLCNTRITLIDNNWKLFVYQ